VKVLFHFQASAWLQSWLAARPRDGCDIVFCPQTDVDMFEHHLPQADVIWHVLTPVTADIIARAPRLRLIQKLGVGVNTIDLLAAARRGITVCNMPGVNSRAVAEMALALMLAAARRLPLLVNRLQAGHWTVPEPIQDSLFELHGKTVGLVGSGNVPRILAPWLDAIGAKVVYHNRSATPAFAYEWLPLDDLLRCSDIVSLHLPLAAETQGMIGHAQFQQMKPQAILVNTARGELVDEMALQQALDQRRLALACLDVFAHEPITADHPLLGRDDVIATPHTAWLTRDMFMRAMQIALDNTRRLASDQTLLHRIAVT